MNTERRTLSTFMSKRDIKREEIPLNKRVHCDYCNYFVHENLISNLKEHIKRMHLKKENKSKIGKVTRKRNRPQKPGVLEQGSHVLLTLSVDRTDIRTGLSGKRYSINVLCSIDYFFICEATSTCTS